MYPTENHYDHDHQHQNQDQHHQDQDRNQDQNQDQTSAIQLIHNSSEVKSKLSKPRVQTFKIKICSFPFKCLAPVRRKKLKANCVNLQNQVQSFSETHFPLSQGEVNDNNACLSKG